MRVPVERVAEQIAAVFGAWGMDPDHIRTAVDVMVDTDLAGIDSVSQKGWAIGDVRSDQRI